VKLNSLHLTNFRQHTDSLIEFHDGLTGIIGPNGSGKTTILEAIAWALYGTSAARGTRDSIRSIRAPARSPVTVDLDFNLGGHRYRVVRGLTTAELFLDGSAAPIANTINGVNELLQRRIGMTRGEFFNTYFTGQKELSVMAAMGPSERAHFLSRVLGYEKLRTAQTLVRDKRKLINAEVTGLRSAMPDPEALSRALGEIEQRVAAELRIVHTAEKELSARQLQFESLAPRWTNAQREREQLLQATSELRVAESEFQTHLRDRDRIAAELREVAVARADLDALRRQLSDLPDVTAELHIMDELYRAEGRRQALVDNERSLGEELTRLRERLERIQSAPTLEEEVTVELERQRQLLEDVQGQLEAQRTAWVRDRQEAETKLQALRQQYSELRAQRDRISELGSEGNCPTCSRALGESFHTVIDHLDEQIEVVRVDGNYFKSRMEQLDNMPGEVRALDERRRELSQETAGLERRLAKVQAAVQELTTLRRDIVIKEERQQRVHEAIASLPSGFDAERHAHLRAELERLAPLETRAVRLSATIEREPFLKHEQRQVSERVEIAESNVAALRKRLERVSFSEDQFVALRTSYEEAAAGRAAAEVALLAAQSELRSAYEALEALEQQHKELRRIEEKLGHLQRDRRLHDELDRAYTDLRTDLNLQLRPELSDLASAFLAELTDDRYGQLELDDQYNIIVLEDGIPKPVISGGEEDLANLVLRLAISQMIAERAGQAFSLLILDEVFGSLDESRRHNVVDLLRRLQDRFEQVILITHIESVREGLDRVVTVSYDPETGVSTVDQPSEGYREPSPMMDELQPASAGE
jgi:DNA repair protein SbcC/Rad50